MIMGWRCRVGSPRFDRGEGSVVAVEIIGDRAKRTRLAHFGGLFGGAAAQAAETCTGLLET